MYAVIRDGGRQYKVKEGDRILIDLKAGAEPGAEVEFGDVLLLSDGQGSVKVGTPGVPNALVRGKVLGEEKGEKLAVFKKRRRKNSKVKRGHRQHHIAVKIEKIEG